MNLTSKSRPILLLNPFLCADLPRLLSMPKVKQRYHSENGKKNDNYSYGNKYAWKKVRRYDNFFENLSLLIKLLNYETLRIIEILL